MKNLPKINWFPGHMAKNIKEIKEKIKKCDVIINVIDARAIKTTNALEEFVEKNTKKLIINVATKTDLASLDKKNKNDILFLSCKDKNIRTKLLEIILKKTKDLDLTMIICMIVGLPNVGKSTLINCLCNNKKRCITKNVPGTTQNTKNIVKISNSIYVYDSPGIMYKKIDNILDGYILCALNCIGQKAMIESDVANWCYNFYIKNYFIEMKKKWQLLTFDMNFPAFIEQIYMINQNKNFSEKCNIFLNKFVFDLPFKINYEKK